MRLGDGGSRTSRGLGQGGVGYVIVDCLDEFTRWDPTTRQYGLAVLVLGAVVSYAQNFAENKGWIKPFLRTVPQEEAAAADV